MLLATEDWVFGMVDTFCSPSPGYMELVPDRSAATLLRVPNHLNPHPPWY